MIEVMTEYGCKPDGSGIYSEAAYMGDDILDIPPMMICGVRACPADAVDEVKKICSFVSSKDGGNGAVRDFIEYIKSESN